MPRQLRITRKPNGPAAVLGLLLMMACVSSAEEINRMPSGLDTGTGLRVRTL